MQFPTMTIGNDDATPTRRGRRVRKSRAFQCLLLRAVLWTNYRDNKRWMRPIFLDFCGTESQHRAFVANLRCGRVAVCGAGSRDEGFELLRSEAYVYAPPQKCDADVRQVVYMPALFDIDVKGQSEDIWLCAMPAKSLLQQVTRDEFLAARAALQRLNKGVEEQRRLVEEENKALEWWRKRAPPQPLELDDDVLTTWALVSREVAVRLDSRTRFPVPAAPEFRALLLWKLLMVGAVWLCDRHPLEKLYRGRERSYSKTEGLIVKAATDYLVIEDAGYLAPTAVSLKQAILGPLLSALAKDYYANGDVV